MDGWQTLISAAASGVGVLVFLKGVANEIENAERSVARLEQAERKNAKKSRQAAAVDSSASQGVAKAA